MKIAICIPSLNESENIQVITKKIDEGLREYQGIYDFVIVNADNNSLDKTSELFLQTNTMSKKVVINNTKLGKGVNLFSFFTYFLDNEFDYALTFDADVVSFEKNWIKKYLDKLVFGKCDLVLPYYERSIYEGSTTNQLCFPLLTVIFNVYMRQPIGGDFGLSRRLIQVVNDRKNRKADGYGIDIFISWIALIEGYSIESIDLPAKIHSPSFAKIEKISAEVIEMLGVLLVTDSGAVRKKLKERSFFVLDSIELRGHPKMIKRFKFSQKHKTKSLKRKSLNYFNTSNANINTKCILKKGFIDLEEWCVILAEFIFTSLECSDSGALEERIEDIKRFFLIRAISFWEECEKNGYSFLESEKILHNQVKTLYKIIN